MKKFLKGFLILLLILLIGFMFYCLFKHMTQENLQDVLRQDTSVEFKSQLVSTPENPVPSGSIIDVLEVEPGLEIRVASWESTNKDSLGSVLVFPGYTEFIEKYYETISDLRNMGLNVVVLDWRGQGLSSKLLSDKDKGYIEDFADFGMDAEIVYQQVLNKLPKPHFLIGHSMGGHLAFRELQDHPNRYVASALCAPMQKINSMENDFLHSSSSWFETFGLGQSYVTGGGEGNMNKSHKRLTSDSVRHQNWITAFQKEPRLLMGSATWTWSRAGAESMIHTMQDEQIKKIQTPIYLASPKSDDIVDPSSHDGLDKINNKIKVVSYPNAEHEIFIEQDKMRDRFLKDIKDWFVLHSQKDSY